MASKPKTGKRPPGQHIDAKTIDEIVALLKRKKTAAEVARTLGLAWNTVKKIRDDLAAGRDPHRAKFERKEKAKVERFHLGGSPTDRKVVELEDTVARLHRELKDAHRQTLADDAIARIVGRVAEAPRSPPDWLVEPSRRKGRTAEVPVAILADWHLGETVSLTETNGINQYDPEIAGDRVRRVVTSMIDIAENHGPGVYPGAVVNLLGDFVSGGIHPELEKTDTEEVIPSAVRALDLLEWAIDTLAAKFGRLYVPCVSGNHGRTTKKPEAKRYVYKNFDWLVEMLLAKRFAASKSVVFAIPDSNEVLYRVFGQRYLALHGDQMGVKGGDGIIGALGPIARGAVKVGKQASSIGRDYDVLLMGHWHQELWLNGVIVANTLKGFDEFAHKVLRAPPSPASQPLWFVHPLRGITSRWDVKADSPRASVAEPWVSFQEV